MELSSHVISNLDQWVENGFINIKQREAFTQLATAAVQDAYEAGTLVASADHDTGYDGGYSDGYSDGEYSGNQDGYDEGYAAALSAHNIER